METIRKVVEKVTGDAGTDAIARQQQAEHAAAAAGGGATREEETHITTATSPTAPTTTTTEQQRAAHPVVEEPGSPPATETTLRQRSGQPVGEQKSMEPTTTERREVLRTGETPLETDKERQKREEESLKRQRELREGGGVGEWERERGRGEERAGLFGTTRTRSPEPYRRTAEYGTHEEDKGFLEKTKEFFGVGETHRGGEGLGGGWLGMGARESEETRQLGLEKGQVPYQHPEEAEYVRRRYIDERRAIDSGHVYEGQRLKDPEFYRSTFLRTPEEEEESERRWEERRASVGYSDVEHVSRPSAITPRGGLTSVLGRVTSALGLPAVGTSTKYPLCIRAIVHPRKDTHDSRVEGDIILVQDHPGAPTQVIGSVRGINPGVHGLVILENGDLSLERSSAGLHFDAPGSVARHGGANTKERHLGDLGNIIVKDDGVSFFNFRVANLPLIDVAGRALAVMSGEDDLGRSECQCSGGSCQTAAKGVRHRKCGPKCRGAAGGCFACISDRTGNSGHALGLGVLVRTDLRAMERLKNIMLGVGIGDETHSEVHGRTMQERMETERLLREGERERGYSRGGGIEGAWETIKSTFTGSTLSREERDRMERGLPGRQLQDFPEREREVRGREYVALPLGSERETYGRPSEDDAARRQQQLRQRELEHERDIQERERQRQLDLQTKERERQQQLERQERQRADKVAAERAQQIERERQREREMQHQRLVEAERQQKDRERQLQREHEREVQQRERQRQLEIQERDRQRQYEMQREVQQKERERQRQLEERDRQRQYELQKERERQRQYEVQKEREYEQKSRSDYPSGRTSGYYSMERFEHPERTGEDIGGKIKYFGSGARPAASGKSAHADY